jgi:copper(I)-binding protein
MILLAGILLLSGCDTASGITVSDAWARPAMQGDIGAVYFLLQNHSASVDELTGISSDVAETVEMHESKMEGDVMKMQQISYLPIEGQASIKFEPGGYHVMLIRLKQELKVGDEIEISLHFKENEDITITVPVQEHTEGESMENH